MTQVGDIVIQGRRDSTANWTAVNPTPALGEICLDMTVLQFKVGDGVTDWINLPYWGPPRVHITQIPGATHTLTPGDENGCLICTNAGGCIVTLPNFSDVALPNGYITHIHQDAAGTVELVAASGVTIKTAISRKTRTTNSSLSVIVQAQNVFKIIGDALYE